VLNNQTLMQVFLVDINSTMYEVLTRLGIIEQQLNLTLQYTNQTLQIVNESAQDIDELVNRSRRIKPWVTQ